MRPAIVVPMLVILVLLVLTALVALGWVFSSRFLVVQPYTLLPEFEIIAVEPADGSLAVTLPTPDAQPPPQFADTRKAGVYNLLWEGGYGRLGEVLSDDGATVTRVLERVEGRPPEAGAPARLDTAVFRRDPLADHAIPFDEIALQGETGRLAAWWVDQGVDTAVLMLHGRRRADRTETLRIMPMLHTLGFSVMALAYRNHDVSDMSPDGLYHYGASEYRDALVALDFLKSRGIERVVLYGFSTGAEVALMTIRHWPDTGAAPLALVLDSPFLDVRAVIRQGARALDLPATDLLSDLALLVGGWRTGVDWSDLDQRRFAPDLQVPVLIIAGTADSTIPIETVDAFAAAVASPLRYERLEGVEHVEAWNAFPERYEGWVREFLAPWAPGDAP